MGMRTDLALESAERAEASGGTEGIVKTERSYDSAGLRVTEISIETEAAARALGRPVGKYITVSCCGGRLSELCENAEERAECLAGELRRVSELPGKVLIAGLGNTAITSDSLGPRTASGILATRHIKRLARDIDTAGLSEVTVISAGVMAQTGLESQEVVRSVREAAGAELVIAVDALACSELSHLGSTVQFCSTGISPGSGVGNSRSELSEATLGVPCIAIGIPTVTDCEVIAESAGGEIKPEYGGMIVTPRDIDELIARSSGLLSMAINRALHPDLGFEELSLLMN